MGAPGRVVAHCVRNVPSWVRSAQQCNVPVGMKVPKSESDQIWMCPNLNLPSGTNIQCQNPHPGQNYIYKTSIELTISFFINHHPTTILWKNSKKSEQRKNRRRQLKVFEDNVWEEEMGGWHCQEQILDPPRLCSLVHTPKHTPTSNNLTNATIETIESVT